MDAVGDLLGGWDLGMVVEAQVRIESEYRDGWGNVCRTPGATVARLEAALQRTARGEALVAAAPAVGDLRCFEPPWMARGERRWGITAQLYGLRSPRNWGIGDFTDLKQLIRLAAKEGADFVGVNPLHALYAADPMRFSPYSPSSREFFNVLYIDPMAMRALVLTQEAQRHIAAPEFQTALTSLRAAELINYPAVAACKDVIFRLVFDALLALRVRELDHPLAVAFQQFVAARGEALRRFAVFQALSCEQGFAPSWMAWPTEYRNPDGDAVRKFAETHQREVAYHQFLQWEADAQLSDCAAAARESGMSVGLYLDLAVGTGPESAEAWSEQENIIPGFYIGAPPDAWNSAGQDWGLAVHDPNAIACSDYRVFRRILRALMRHAAALRIDHVLGFHRLFLVPAGGVPRDGVYLRLPAKALCDALAAESGLHRCLIIGEDLGSVPEGFTALLTAHGILSCRLLIFARDGNRFLRPEEYPPNALVSIATHDLPPLLGYWSGTDVVARAALGLYHDELAAKQATEERRADCTAMLSALSAAGFPVHEQPADLVLAAHGFLARSPCHLFAVQMEDLALEQNQPNLPGSSDLYPNWRRKLVRELDAILADPRAASLFAAIRRERPRGAGT
jgi:(1->4)-alpha-D-glucan 1-alpha-D-glucosylmutase